MCELSAPPDGAARGGFLPKTGILSVPEEWTLFTTPWRMLNRTHQGARGRDGLRGSPQFSPEQLQTRSTVLMEGRGRGAGGKAAS